MKNTLLLLLMLSCASCRKQSASLSESVNGTALEAKQELALLIADCKRGEVEVSAIKENRKTQADYRKRLAKDLKAWAENHPSLPEYKIAFGASVMMQIASERIEKSDDELNQKLTGTTLKKYQQELSDYFSILVGMK